MPLVAIGTRFLFVIDDIKKGRFRSRPEAVVSRNYPTDASADIRRSQ